MNIPANAHGALADYAERLLRQNSETWVANVNMSSEDVANVREGDESFIRHMRETVESGAVREALVLFGNASDAGFRFLVEAMPHIPQHQRAACVEEAWTRGLWAEHDFFGTGAPPGRGLTPVTLKLFEQAPALRETVAALNLPDRVTVYRGVQAKHLRAARTRLRQVAWTLRRDVAAWFAHDVAQWFAHRRADRETMFLARATVQRDRILAYFDAPQGATIIVNPDHLEDVTVEWLSDGDLNAAQDLTETRTHVTQ